MRNGNFLSSLKNRKEVFFKRAVYLEEVRGFFRDGGFLEVDAPLLVKSPGMEPHLDAFMVEGSYSGSRYTLPTSPEFYLKKLLASGVEKCFCLGSSFRDDIVSNLHSPEFLMIEWYRSDIECDALLPDCEGLLEKLAGRFTKTGKIEIGGSTCDLTAGVESLALSDVFREAVGADWLDFSSLSHWREAALSMGALNPVNWSENDCFSFLMISKVEPALRSFAKPVALFGYPAFQAALARISKKDSRVSERFELFLAGVEIGNAYTELTNGAELRQRMRVFSREREAMGKEPHPVDEEFLEAVDNLDPCAGIALGADRLFALLMGRTLADVRHGT